MKSEQQILVYDPSFNTVPVSLVKIDTCGGLRIEVLQQSVDVPTQARYGAPLDVGSARQRLCSAQTLLKMLISAPIQERGKDVRYATK